VYEKDKIMKNHFIQNKTDCAACLKNQAKFLVA